MRLEYDDYSVRDPLNRKEWAEIQRPDSYAPASDSPPPWEDKAACAGLDGDLFFVPAVFHRRAVEARVERARAVCSSCPVQSECLEVALASPWIVGVWGGTTEQERKEIRRGDTPSQQEVQARA
jgi:WhiB family transcriptional regulator, redox-sensing transcriptional regulator